jgi:hypothetical protein
MNIDAQTIDPMDALIEAINANARVTPKLRTAMLSAMLGETEISSITQLARACQCDRTTLWRHWREAFPAKPNPKDVLNYIRLLRSLASGKPIKRGSFARKMLIELFGIIPSGELNIPQMISKSVVHLRMGMSLRGELMND